MALGRIEELLGDSRFGGETDFVFRLPIVCLGTSLADLRTAHLSPRCLVARLSMMGVFPALHVPLQNHPIDKLDQIANQ
jgi:hypothetical protein